MKFWQLVSGTLVPVLSHHFTGGDLSFSNFRGKGVVAGWVGRSKAFPGYRGRLLHLISFPIV